MHVPFSASKIGLILSCLVFPSSELEAAFSFKMLFDSGILKKPQVQKLQIWLIKAGNSLLSKT